MIGHAELRNPLRWYLAALLLGAVVCLFDGHFFILKYRNQRWAELLPALGLLAWCYRSQPLAFFSQPLLSGWYGLGLTGLALAALIGGAVGPIAWISLAFVGLILLQFALLPLLQPAWRTYGADTTRVLALFTVALLGIDVGVWLVDHLLEITPYAAVPLGRNGRVPYLFLNPRFANQVALLLLWSFLPLLQQLQDGVIHRWRGFWWGICAAIPLLAMAQIVWSSGDGAFLAVGVAAVGLMWMALRPSPQQPLYRMAVLLLLGGTLVAALLAQVLDGGQFLGEVVERNLEQVAPAAAGGDRRIVHWPAYLQAWLQSPLVGVGIPAVPAPFRTCAPHNIWLSLLYWSGLLGTACGLLLTAGFVPRRWRGSGVQLMALPLLASLFVYQLVDDIWIRPQALALLLVLLPALTAESPQAKPAGGILTTFAFPGSTYRLLALVGVLLIVVSVVVPEGVGWGPSPLVRMAQRNAICLLFF